MRAEIGAKLGRLVDIVHAAEVAGIKDEADCFAGLVSFIAFTQ